MIPLATFASVKNVLCLGAHCDDVEIGAGGTLLKLIKAHPHLKFHWVVFGGKEAARQAEARAAADKFLAASAGYTVDVQQFADSFFTYSGEAIKRHFLVIREQFAADVVLTHHSDDRHQDHRLINEFTWNTFRNHQILEYEIPKWDGDLSRPSIYSPLDLPDMEKKVDLLMELYATQRSKAWFTPDTFKAVMRLRGMECNSTSGYAEAFHTRKLAIG